MISALIVNFTTSCKKRQLNTKLVLAKTDINLFQRHIESQFDLSSSFNTEAVIDYAVERFSKVITSFKATPQNLNYSSNFRLSVEKRSLITAKRRLRNIWKSLWMPVDKTNFNRAASHLNKILRTLKNYAINSCLYKLSPANKTITISGKQLNI